MEVFHLKKKLVPSIPLTVSTKNVLYLLYELYFPTNAFFHDFHISIVDRICPFLTVIYHLRLFYASVNPQVCCWKALDKVIS